MPFFFVYKYGNSLIVSWNRVRFSISASTKKWNISRECFYEFQKQNIPTHQKSDFLLIHIMVCFPLYFFQTKKTANKNVVKILHPFPSPSNSNTNTRVVSNATFSNPTPKDRTTGGCRFRQIPVGWGLVAFRGFGSGFFLPPWNEGRWKT